MRVAFFVLWLVAASAQAGWPEIRNLERTMESPLAPEIETALSNVLGQDGNRILNTPLCELDPDVAVDALEACMSTLIKEVEPHCADSLNLHALAAYTKHMIMEARFMGVQEIRRDLSTSSRLQNLIQHNGQQTVRPGSLGKVPGLARFARKLQNSIDQKVNSVIQLIGGTEKLTGLFDILPLDVDIDVIMDMTLEETLVEIVPLIRKVFSGFNEPENCDVQLVQQEVLSAVEELYNYLNGEFRNEPELQNIPEPYKKELEMLLGRNLGALAKNLHAMTSQYASGNAKSAIQSYFVETVGSVIKDIHISKALENGELVQRMAAVVRILRRRGGDNRVAKAFIRTLAMTMTDFDIPLETVKDSIQALVVAMERSGTEPQTKYQI